MLYKGLLFAPSGVLKVRSSHPSFFRSCELHGRVEDKIFPHDIRACPLKLGAHKAEVRLPGASAAVTTAQGSDLAVVNVGCYVPSPDQVGRIVRQSARRCLNDHKCMEP